MRWIISLGLITNVWVGALGQLQAGPWLFTVDEKKSEFYVTVTLDLGLVKEADDDSSRIKGSFITELEPDKAPESIRITNLEAQPIKSKLQFSYSFGPFGLLGKARFTVSDFKILLDSDGTGEAAVLDEAGRFVQTGNVPAITGFVKYDVDTALIKQKGQIELSEPEGPEEDAAQAEPFEFEGQLTWSSNVPVLTFNFDIEQELESEEFNGITVLVSAQGTVVARGERLVIEPPDLEIVVIDGGRLQLGWQIADHILEAAVEPTFAESKIVELDEGQTRYITRPGPDQPQQFFRLRAR